MAKAKWLLDKDHSVIEFSVKHMMIAKVRGYFEKFDAEIEADPEDLTTASIFFTIKTASIQTKNKDRDTHLTSDDFFGSETYPDITFKAAEIKKQADGDYQVSGGLTIKDTTRTETFTVSYEGQGQDPWGNTKAGFSARTTIKRSEYGLTYNAALETGGVLIGDDVKITIDLEALKQV